MAGLSNPTPASIWMKLRGSHTHMPKKVTINMEQRKNDASETASGLQYITHAGCLRAGHLVTNESHVLVATGGASGTNLCTATTRCTESTQQSVTQPDGRVYAVLPQQTTTMGKPHQRIKWDDEMNTFIIRSYYTLTRNEMDMAM